MLTTRILLTIALFLAATPAWATDEDLDIRAENGFQAQNPPAIPVTLRLLAHNPLQGAGVVSPAPAKGRGNEVIDQNTGERLKMTRGGMGPSDPAEPLWGSADNPLPRASRKPWGSLMSPSQRAATGFRPWTRYH